MANILKQGPEQYLRNVQLWLDGHNLGFSPETLLITNFFSVLNSTTGKYLSIFVWMVSE